MTDIQKQLDAQRESERQQREQARYDAAGWIDYSDEFDTGWGDE